MADLGELDRAVVQEASSARRKSDVIRRFWLSRSRITLVSVAIVLASACGSSAPSPQPTSSVRSTGTETTAPTSSPLPSVSPAGQETPLPSAVAAILADRNYHLDLDPLPADHTVSVDRETAIDAVLRYMNVNGPVAYVAHGLHRRMSVWLVIAKGQDMAPFPVGPRCPSPPNGCTQTWAVNDYAVAFVSDESGQVFPALTTMLHVPAPTST